mmetsp:Transcript_22560/g.53203  ORF Transcript_22560/g.53203 Transcript_22560/m.53203 type:complete len:483 (+) Transcript_22560:81-1529(+)|eukprot:CAMPEP_0168770518 /NCGR_PEP_ID=MMETSP0725-20121227/2961_1 /TAXON_ID=265536 /ORGANISM="Amphiprora sp., Strain CCMP467" /LENGTH=482 /DNA_ID=CAMNT_0008819965 /DNA_START=66 /DNA_END=1514 /DNA_ORIENTATION=+
MTLTTVVGSSGSGKTTFLNDVHKSNKCTYIRQYHTMRPYIPVSKIPNFDPTGLPYWEIYENEGKGDSIQVGGTMAGEFTAGLSGGQRKLLLFELICQRTADQSELLIALDEPFAGVTDDFVPFIVERLNDLRKKHNVILVTNDHVETLTEMADNTITVSAINRTVVKVNDMEGVDRQRAIFALSLGDDYQYNSSSEDLKFFAQTEIMSPQLLGVTMFSVFSHALFVATFWDSSRDSAGLVLVAGSIIAFFCINPYLLALTEWRNAMEEEAEALMHSSKALNRALKTCLTIMLVFLLSWAEYGVVQATIDGLDSIEQWVAMFFDSASMTFPLICLGIYTKLGFQQVEILGTMPFLLMIFLSTTFSPGSGVEGLKELRYLFSRFYWWCIVPGVQDDMEGCPDDDLNTLYMILASLVGVFVFLVWQFIGAIRSKKADVAQAKLRESMFDEEFHQLQVSLYGEKALKRLNHMTSSMHSTGTPVMEA